MTHAPWSPRSLCATTTTIYGESKSPNPRSAGVSAGTRALFHPQVGRRPRNRGTRTAGIDAFTRYRVAGDSASSGSFGSCGRVEGRKVPAAAGQRAPDPQGRLRDAPPGDSRRCPTGWSMALKLVMEPIFEASFCPSSTGSDGLLIVAPAAQDRIQHGQLRSGHQTWHSSG